MAPNGPEAQRMRIVEEVMALRVSASEHLRCVSMRMLNRARTREERDDIRELQEAQADLDEMGPWLGELHPHPYRQDGEDFPY